MDNDLSLTLAAAEDYTIVIYGSDLYKNEAGGEMITQLFSNTLYYDYNSTSWIMKDLSFTTTAATALQVYGTSSEYDITITVDGSCTLDSSGNGASSAVASNRDLIFKGSGELNCLGGLTGINNTGHYVTVNGSDLVLNAAASIDLSAGNTTGISASGMQIRSGTVNAAGSKYGYCATQEIVDSSYCMATIYDASGNILTWDYGSGTYKLGSEISTTVSNVIGTVYTLSFTPAQISVSAGGSQTVQATVTDGSSTVYAISSLEFSDSSVAGIIYQSGDSFTVAGAAAGSDSVTVTATLESGKTVSADLSVTVTGIDQIFYSSSWTTGDWVTVTRQDEVYTGKVGGGLFFNDYDAAKTAASSGGKSIVVSESGTLSSPVHYDGTDTVLAGGEAVYNRMVLGGELIAGNHEYTGDYTFTIENGTFNSEIAGGDASNKHVDRSGSITFNISGGTFNGHVLGGGYYAGQNLGNYALTGDVNFTISGGTFAERVYGGCGSFTEETSALAAMQGSVNLTIDASENTISFGECVAAGNRGNGLLVGSTSVTVKGSGANLHFADASVLFGGCGGDYYRTENGVRRAVTSVVDPVSWSGEGVRSLVFDNFSGDFGAEIRMFSDVSFLNGTAMNFADEKLDLKEVSVWNFDCTSFAGNLNQNDFTGDVINVDTAGLSGNWTLLSGDAAAFDELTAATGVYFDGLEASCSGGVWSYGDYTLALAEQENKTCLVVSKIS